MRREHIKSESYIDWLKSLGCVFYAPLTVDNNDVINNTAPDSSRGSVNTRDDRGLYFNGSSGLRYPSSVFNNFILYDHDFTFLCDCMITQMLGSNNWYKAISFLSSANYRYEKTVSVDCATSSFYYNVNSKRSNNISGQVITNNTQYNKLGVIYNSQTHTFSKVENGIISGSQGVSNNFENNQSMCIGCERLSNNYFRGYIRNVMVFNTALSQQEITQL